MRAPSLQSLEVSDIRSADRQAIDVWTWQLWHLWKTYLWRWLLIKLYQALAGLLFGLLCWAVFTPLQNLVNTPRVRWKNWLTVIGVWVGVKLLYLAIAGGFA